MKSNAWFLLIIVTLVFLTFVFFYSTFIDKESNQEHSEPEIPISTVTFSHFEIYVPETEDIEQHEPEVEKQPKLLGEFILTAYCPCTKCCGIWGENRDVDEDGKTIVEGSIGTRLAEGRSIAVDPTVIPYGAEVIIDGKVYVAEDCGGAIKGNRIDVFFNDHESALNFGRQAKVVYMEG